METRKMGMAPREHRSQCMCTRVQCMHALGLCENHNTVPDFQFKNGCKLHRNIGIGGPDKRQQLLVSIGV